MRKSGRRRNSVLMFLRSALHWEWQFLGTAFTPTMWRILEASVFPSCSQQSLYIWYLVFSGQGEILTRPLMLCSGRLEKPPLPCSPFPSEENSFFGAEQIWEGEMMWANEAAILFLFVSLFLSFFFPCVAEFLKWTTELSQSWFCS